ncbi:hypothetical protein [Micrococcoides hystricis]|uniref:Uncharacterized protein n=1 Tax=Micrococcoides hystricis TaxID=1572761 RepID=A0ABV6P6L2_9MICC
MNPEEPGQDLNLAELQETLNKLRLQLDQTIQADEQDAAAVDELLGLDRQLNEHPQSLW